MYVTIEEDILFNEDLTIQEKVIVSLVKSMNKLFVSNEKIGKMIGVSKSRVSAIISGLVKKGYLNVDCKREKGVNTERTITLGAIFSKVQDVIKKAASKAKEIKQGYSAIKTTVGTQQVEQVTFSQTHYKKADKSARFTNIMTHDWDMNKLEALEQDYIEEQAGEFNLEEMQNRLNNMRGNKDGFKKH